MGSFSYGVGRLRFDVAKAVGSRYLLREDLGRILACCGHAGGEGAGWWEGGRVGGCWCEPRCFSGRGE